MPRRSTSVECHGILSWIAGALATFLSHQILRAGCLTRPLREDLEGHAEPVGNHAVGRTEIGGAQLDVDLSALFQDVVELFRSFSSIS
ncbi:hypothetical protein D3C80_2024690 [compost metagenome]